MEIALFITGAQKLRQVQESIVGPHFALKPRASAWRKRPVMPPIGQGRQMRGDHRRVRREPVFQDPGLAWSTRSRRRKPPEALSR